MELFLFDIDGTLIESPRRAGRRALERACQETLGIEAAAEGISFDGKTDPLIVEEIFRARRGRTPSPAELSEVLSSYLRCLDGELLHDDAVRVLPSVEESLARLRARAAMVGLATGNVEDGARRKLTRAGLWSHFAFGGYGSDAADRGELVRMALRRADERSAQPIARDRAWVVGDTPRDIHAAHAAGIRAIGVATGGFTEDELRAAGADRVLSTLADLA